MPRQISVIGSIPKRRDMFDDQLLLGVELRVADLATGQVQEDVVQRRLADS